MDVQLEQARTDFGRGEWTAAYDAWSAAGLSALSPAELDDFATVTELLGRHDECVAALQREFVLSQEAGDAARGVVSAFRLAMATVAPAAARQEAIPSPMPVPPPVTSATRPASRSGAKMRDGWGIIG